MARIATPLYGLGGVTRDSRGCDPSHVGPETPHDAARCPHERDFANALPPALRLALRSARGGRGSHDYAPLCSGAVLRAGARQCQPRPLVARHGLRRGGPADLGRATDPERDLCGSAALDAHAPTRAAARGRGAMTGPERATDAPLARDPPGDETDLAPLAHATALVTAHAQAAARTPRRTRRGAWYGLAALSG